VFGAQLMVLAVQAALVGVAASWSYWLGNRHTGLAGYYLFAVPRVLIILVGAAIADSAYQWDDLAVFRFAAMEGLLHDVTYPGEAGSGLWQAMLYTDQHVSLGLFTPIAFAFLMSAMTMWARYMNNAYKLVVWPVLGWAAGVVVAFAVAMLNGPVLAAPYIAGGVALATGLAVWRTHTWALVGWAQGWHADQSHRTTMGRGAKNDY